MKRVLIAGEGATELGGWANDPAWREPTKPGVIPALIDAVAGDAVEIGDAIVWRKLPAYVAGGAGSREAKAVAVLAYLTAEQGLDGVVFVRDADGEADRCAALREGKEQVREKFPGVGLAGGCAQPCIEGWGLAVDGQKGSAALGRGAAKERLQALLDPESGAAAFAAFIERKGVDGIAADAVELRSFVAELRALAASGG